MRYLRNSWIAFALAASDFCPVRAQTLIEALTASYRNNPLIAAERAELRSVDEQVPQALANTRPQISANAANGSVRQQANGTVNPIASTVGLGNSYLPTNLPQRSYGVTVTQPLYRGGQTLAQYRAAKSAVASERFKLLDTEAQTLLSAAADYADVAQAREGLALSDKEVATATFDEEQTEARYTGGEMSRTDLAQSQAAKLAAIGQRAQALITLEETRAAFKRDTGLDAGDIVLPPDTSFPISFSLDEAIHLAESSSPAVMEAKLAADSALQKVYQAAGQALPTLSLQGVYEHQVGQSSPGQTVDVEAILLQLTLPLYSGGTLQSQIRAARAVYEQQRALADSAAQSAKYAAVTAWTQFEAAKAAVVAFSAQVSVNETALEGVRFQASAGEKTFQDVHVAELTLLTSREALSQARHDVFVARMNLLAAIGNLEARKLDLPGPYYDPEVNYRSVHLGPGR